MASKKREAMYPMRIQARHGSKVEQYYYPSSRLPGAQWPDPKAIASGMKPSPLDDLIFHGGKVVPQLIFQNIFLGSNADWQPRNIALIDASIKMAMQDRQLNNVMAQYFPGVSLTCDVSSFVVPGGAKLTTMGEADVQAKIAALFKAGQIGQQDLGNTIFNLVLPPGTTLTLDNATSPDGLGGYHGSIHLGIGAKQTTLYYSANVFSQMLPDGRQNGIVAFDEPWKNVVATLYHELNEFRTDPDVNDAIHSNNNDFLGWMSRQGRECGDQPIFVATALNQVFKEVLATDGTTRTQVPIQFMYSNRVHGAEGPIDTPDVAAALPPPRSTVGTDAQGLPLAARIDAVISRNLGALQKPGVLSIRPGYQLAGGWLTKKPSIVVTVDRKRDDVAAEDRLPETLEGYSVDVREGSALERLRATKRGLYQAVATHAAPELLLPAMPYERDVNGLLLDMVEENIAAARAPSKLPLDYVPPANAPLDAITDTFTLTCHVSPDAGWPQLEGFLSQTATSLTVGMYDFTSAHILANVTASLKGRRTLNLVLDHPSRDRTADQSDEDTVAAISSALGGRFDFAWALEGHDPKVTAAIFPSAYHIKVAVRDSKACWLSSGNWNNSNQPDIDPINDPAGAQSQLPKSDRDWHVIVQHEKLSKLFETYLLNDLGAASKHQASSAAAQALDAFADLARPELAAQSRIPRQFFAPKTITAKMRIQPVLTPDNYAAVVLSLINSATRSLYMQIPYITPTDKPESNVLNGLIEAIARKIRAGVDVRLILSSFAKPAALELLQAAGIDASLVKIQNNLHNKGIVVDSSAVLIGSQNWSPPGVTTNRDASLVIENAEAAQYWQGVYLHDWTNMATQHIDGG
jgi:hypothetical protein